MLEEPLLIVNNNSPIISVFNDIELELSRPKDAVEDKFKTIKSVARFAGLMVVSEKKLNKATATTLGKSPKELIDERIILEAKRMLVHTNSSIKEIGFDLGFDEPTNFIKYFRKHEAKTPVAFRKLFPIKK